MAVLCRRPVISYFVLTCVISWTIWLSLVLQSQGIDIPTIPYQHFLGALGPISAAVIVAGVTAGRPAVRHLWRGMLRWRIGLRWHLIGVLGPAVLFVISALGIGMYNGEWANFRTFGQSEEFSTLGLVSIFLINFLTFGIGEEAGWRGFALPRLQVSHSALTSTLMLTIFWAFWHIPLFFYRPGYTSMAGFDIVGWFLSLITGGILLTWLFNSTQGSILVVALFHASVDVAFTSRLVDATVINMMGVLIVVWAIGVVMVTGPATLCLAHRKVIAVGDLQPRSSGNGVHHE